MKNIRMMLYPLALIVLVFSLSGSAFAQEMPVNCYDLDEADCALYTELQANAEAPASAAFTIDVAGEFSIGEEQTPFAVNVSGAYVTDMAAMDAAKAAFGEVTLRDVSLGDVVVLLDDLVSAWDASVSIDLSGIPEAAMLTNGETIDLYFVDGAAYVNSPLLKLAMSDPTLEGVYGIDLFEALDLALSSVTMADLAELGDAFAMDSMNGDAFMEMFEEGFMSGFNQSFGTFGQMGSFNEADLAEAIDVLRLDDEEGSGENLYVFETTIDLGAMFAIPALREQIVAAMEQQFESQDMAGMDAASLMDALENSLEGSTIVITEKYGATSNVVVGADMVMNFVIDSAEFAALMDEPQTGEAEEIAFQLNFSYMLEDINQVESIDLPADAQIVPIMDLLGNM